MEGTGAEGRRAEQGEKAWPGRRGGAASPPYRATAGTPSRGGRVSWWQTASASQAVWGRRRKRRGTQRRTGTRRREPGRRPAKRGGNVRRARGTARRAAAQTGSAAMRSHDPTPGCEETRAGAKGGPESREPTRCARMRGLQAAGRRGRRQPRDESPGGAGGGVCRPRGRTSCGDAGMAEADRSRSPLAARGRKTGTPARAEGRGPLPASATGAPRRSSRATQRNSRSRRQPRSSRGRFPAINGVSTRGGPRSGRDTHGLQQGGPHLRRPVLQPLRVIEHQLQLGSQGRLLRVDVEEEGEGSAGAVGEMGKGARYSSLRLVAEVVRRSKSGARGLHHGGGRVEESGRAGKGGGVGAPRELIGGRGHCSRLGR